MINLLALVPGLAVLLFTCFEMPHKVKKQFFKAPIWISSSMIAILVGAVGRGVLGPMTGFTTELILFPGLSLAKKHFHWKETRLKDRGNRQKVRVGYAKHNGKGIHAVEIAGRAYEVRPAGGGTP